MATKSRYRLYFDKKEAALTELESISRYVNVVSIDAAFDLLDKILASKQAAIIASLCGADVQLAAQEILVTYARQQFDLMRKLLIDLRENMQLYKLEDLGLEYAERVTMRSEIDRKLKGSTDEQKS